MNVDELQSVQSRERQTDTLQQLRETFYEEAGQFIQQLREERDRAADRAEDPFDSPEVNRLTDDIKTAEQTVEAIYERRVGKVVKMASLAAADMPTEDDGLTREERELFETMVDAIESNRSHVLDVIAGEAPTGAVGEDPTADEREPAPDPTPPQRQDVSEAATPQNAAPTETPDSGVDAAEVMGGQSPSAPEAPPDPSGEADPMPSAETTHADGGQRPADQPGDSSADGADGAGVDRRTVRITDDVGEIFGVDQREYDLSADDVVTLPADNADPLVEQDAAEPLE